MNIADLAEAHLLVDGRGRPGARWSVCPFRVESGAKLTMPPPVSRVRSLAVMEMAALLLQELTALVPRARDRQRRAIRGSPIPCRGVAARSLGTYAAVMS